MRKPRGPDLQAHFFDKAIAALPHDPKKLTRVKCQFFDDLIRDRRLTALDLRVAWRHLCCLHAKDGKDFGRSWPSQKTIADELGAAERSVRRSLDHLVDLGLFFKRPQRKRGPKHYDSYTPAIWQLIENRTGESCTGENETESPESTGSTGPEYRTHRAESTGPGSPPNLLKESSEESFDGVRAASPPKGGGAPAEKKDAARRIEADGGDRAEHVGTEPGINAEKEATKVLRDDLGRGRGLGEVIEAVIENGAGHLESKASGEAGKTNDAPAAVLQDGRQGEMPVHAVIAGTDVDPRAAKLDRKRKEQDEEPIPDEERAEVGRLLGELVAERRGHGV